MSDDAFSAGGAVRHAPRERHAAAACSPTMYSAIFTTAL